MKSLYVILVFIFFANCAIAQNSFLLQVPFASFGGSMPVYLQELSTTNVVNKLDFSIIGVEFRFKQKFTWGFSFQVNSFWHQGSYGLKLLEAHGIENSSVVEKNAWSSEVYANTIMNKLDFYLTKSSTFSNKAFDYGFGVKFGQNLNLYSEAFILTEDLRAYTRRNSLTMSNLSYDARAILIYFPEKRPRLCFKFKTSIEVFKINKGDISFTRNSGLTNGQFSGLEDASFLAFASFGFGFYCVISQGNNKDKAP